MRPWKPYLGMFLLAMTLGGAVSAPGTASALASRVAAQIATH